MRAETVDNSQFGFRSGHGTREALITLLVTLQISLKCGFIGECGKCPGRPELL